MEVLVVKFFECRVFDNEMTTLEISMRMLNCLTYYEELEVIPIEKTKTKFEPFPVAAISDRISMK